MPGLLIEPVCVSFARTFELQLSNFKVKAFAELSIVEHVRVLKSQKIYTALKIETEESVNNSESMVLI